MSDFRLRARFEYRGLRARLRDQKAEIPALVRSPEPGAVAVDVGANWGAYLPPVARAVPEARVVAFEPQPSLTACLDRPCAAAGLRNVVVEGNGVSDRNGSLSPAVPGDGASFRDAPFEPAAHARAGRGRTLEVPVRTFDGHFAGEPARVAALTVDAQGHQLAVLRGAEGVLTEHRPLLVCEIEARHLPDGDVARVLDGLRSDGYDGNFVRGGGSCRSRRSTRIGIRRREASGSGTVPSTATTSSWRGRSDGDWPSRRPRKLTVMPSDVRGVPRCRFCGSADLHLCYTVRNDDEYRYLRCPERQLVDCGLPAGLDQEEYERYQPDPRDEGDAGNRAHRSGASATTAGISATRRVRSPVAPETAGGVSGSSAGPMDESRLGMRS